MFTPIEHVRSFTAGTCNNSTINKLDKSMVSKVDSTNIHFSKTCQKSKQTSVDSKNVQFHETDLAFEGINTNMTDSFE